VEKYAERLRAGGDESVMGAFEEGTLVGMVGLYREAQVKRKPRAWI
jgi:hypothetical protein